MYVNEVATGKHFPAIVEPISKADLKLINSKTFFFNWKLEKSETIFKLKIKGQTEILGLASLVLYEKEQRVEVKLLAVSKQNFGKEKRYDRVVGNLLGFASRSAVKSFGAEAAISLIPKTGLVVHYCTKYRFEQAGRSLFLYGKTLLELLNEYEL